MIYTNHITFSHIRSTNIVVISEKKISKQTSNLLHMFLDILLMFVIYFVYSVFLYFSVYFFSFCIQMSLSIFCKSLPTTTTGWKPNCSKYHIISRCSSTILGPDIIYIKITGKYTTHTRSIFQAQTVVASAKPLTIKWCDSR